eukprot:scaffold1516_cov230-Pinguiococcus_pyrenoidosus.AAC.5
MDGDKNMKSWRDETLDEETKAWMGLWMQGWMHRRAGTQTPQPDGVVHAAAGKEALGAGVARRERRHGRSVALHHLHHCRSIPPRVVHANPAVLRPRCHELVGRGGVPRGHAEDRPGVVLAIHLDRVLVLVNVPTTHGRISRGREHDKIPFGVAPGEDAGDGLPVAAQDVQQASRLDVPHPQAEILCDGDGIRTQGPLQRWHNAERHKGNPSPYLRAAD